MVFVSNAVVCLQGKLVVAVPLNGCFPLRPPPRSNKSDVIYSDSYFALIKREECNFDLKVLTTEVLGPPFDWDTLLVAHLCISRDGRAHTLAISA